LQQARRERDDELLGVDHGHVEALPWRAHIDAGPDRHRAGRQ
jgi:hypothetical protein